VGFRRFRVIARWREECFFSIAVIEDAHPRGL
jgi:hypothetical protein